MPKENNSGFQEHTKAYGSDINKKIEQGLSLCGKLIPSEYLHDEPPKSSPDCCNRCSQIWDMDHKGMEDTGELDEQNTTSKEI